jgi:hypothetical protein
MEKISKERLTDILSIVSRTLALALGLAIVFAGGYFFEYQKQEIDRAFDKADLSASIISSPVHVIAKKVANETSKKNIRQLMNLLPSSEETNEFLKNVGMWSDIVEIKTDVVGRGFFLSVLSSTTGNTLHPFWGYFSVNNGTISEVIWGKDSYGIIGTTLIEQAGDEFNIASLTNMGPYPWSVEDTWINEAAQEEVVLVSEQQKKSIGMGEQATIIFQKTSSFQLKNQEKGFRVILSKD